MWWSHQVDDVISSGTFYDDRLRTGIDWCWNDWASDLVWKLMPVTPDRWPQRFREIQFERLRSIVCLSICKTSVVCRGLFILPYMGMSTERCWRFDVWTCLHQHFGWISPNCIKITIKELLLRLSIKNTLVYHTRYNKRARILGKTAAHLLQDNNTFERCMKYE